MMNSATPVLIVGGGPVGLALACDLGRRGVAATLVEQRGDEPLPAKMLEVGVRTMEFCRQIGVDKDVKAGPFDPDHPLDNAFVTSLRGYELGRVEIPSPATAVDTTFSPERMRVCPQTWFDPILRNCAQKFPHIRLRNRVKLESFEQDGDGVTAVVADLESGKRECVRVSYLVGCDGFSSTVRDLLGIEIRGERNVEWSLSAYVEIPDFGRAPHIKPAFRYVFVGPEGTWGYISFIDGKRLWRLTIGGRERDKLETTDVGQLLKCAAGWDVPFKLMSKSLWVRRRTIADRFSDGRVFLAGDAAHAHPPNGGLGMNTGIQDAFDLGWKLAATLGGWGGNNLLASYDVERRPAGARGTEVSLMNYERLKAGTRHAAIEAAGTNGEAARQEIGKALVEENRKAWHPMGVHLGYIYSPSLIVVPDGSPKPADDTVHYTPTSFPGARAPHVWLDASTSILDFFGESFVLLKFRDVPTRQLETAAAQVQMPLQVKRIDSDEAAKLYYKALVLVRPDGHVAWRGDVEPADARALIDVVRGAGPAINARRDLRPVASPGSGLRAVGGNAA